MGLSFEISQNKLAGLSATLQSALAKVVETTAFEISEEAKLRAPVDTGNLRASISSESAGLSGSISVGADYGAAVEFGGVYTSPQPYLTPAVSEAKDGFIQRIKSALKENTA